MKFIKRVLRVLLAMSGILTDKLTPLRILLLIIIAAGYFIHYNFNKIFSFEHALIYFGLTFSTRYLFLFNSFTKNGIAKKLISRLGENKGYDVYQFLTALMFFFGAASYTLLVTKSAGLFFSSLNIPEPYLFITGIIVLSIGTLVNTWSTLLVGIDIYYYKDLFLRKPVGKFEKKGPYLLFSNPMYGLGQSSGYGTALMYGSAAGIIAILLNQIMMYIFYYTIEKPHIERLFGKDIALEQA